MAMESMEWTANLKRTRHGAIDSETSTEDQFNPPRPHLEALPTEILQQIFLNSMNGNLITASPVIGVKLSGQISLYRAAFLLAFYNHDVHTMFEIHKLHSFIPMLLRSPSSWDVRSLTKAVLGSRWCTCGQVKVWLKHNFYYCYQRLLQLGEPGSKNHFHMYSDETFRVGDDYLYRTWTADDGTERCVQLEPDIWDLRLMKEGDFDKDQHLLLAEISRGFDMDQYDAEWHSEILFQCQFRIFGVVTVKGDGALSSAMLSRDDAPLLDIVKSSLHLDVLHMKPQPTSLDFFQLLERRALEAASHPHHLRKALALDYFLSPDDQPFKISPRLYRAAAEADLRLSNRASLCFAMLSVHVLFQVDPVSLPAHDLALTDWATKARVRIQYYHTSLIKLQDELDSEVEATRGILRNRIKTRFRAKKLQMQYVHEMDINVLRYMATGSLSSSPDSIMPVFHHPLGWLGERLNASVAALTEAENASHPYSDRRDFDIFTRVTGHYPRDPLFDEKNPIDDEVRLLVPLPKPVGLFYPVNRFVRHDNFDEDVPDESHTGNDESGDRARNQPLEPANIHYGELSEEVAFDFSESHLVLDCAVMQLRKELPTLRPIKDCELVEMFEQPEWFCPTKKYYLLSLTTARNISREYLPGVPCPSELAIRSKGRFVWLESLDR